MRTLLLAFLLIAPLALVATPPASAACRDALGVPCGRIYPIILISTDDKSAQFNLSADHPLDVSATITFRFDMVNEGYTATQPNDQITMTFEFPRKPAWVDMSVEPDKLVVDTANPTDVQPDTSDPTNPQASYVWTTKVKIHAALNGAQPVLRDGLDYAKLLVFAKSTESGLYQAGYGIKELRVIPAGAVHDADVAGQKDSFTATPLANFTLAPVTSSFGAQKVTLTPPASVSFWTPNLFDVKLDPAPSGMVVITVHDEGGNLSAMKGPIDASSGDLKLNVTLAHPGLHTVAVTLLPAAGSTTPPMTFPLSFIAGDVKAEGYAFPKSYLVATADETPAPTGNSADPLAQFERDVPFFAYDTAQSVTATVSLDTPGAPTTTGLSNLQVALLDPEGKQLLSNSLDPVSFPTRVLRVGAIPGDGWYTLRISGIGAPQAAGYLAQVEVAYSSPPLARNHANGIADATGDTLSRAGRNVTLPVANLSVWSPADITPKFAGFSGARYSLTIVDANGTLAYASGARTGKASFTPPGPGTYRAFFYAEPAPPAAAFAPTTRAFTFDVGDGKTTVAQKFSILDAPEAPTSKDATTLAIYAVPYRDVAATGKAAATLAAPGSASASLVDAAGKAAEKPGAPGTYYLVVSATNPGPTASVPVKFDLDFPSAQTLIGAEKTPSAGKSGIPGLGAAAVLGALGVLALARRMRARR